MKDMRERIMMCMTIRQIRALKDDYTDLYDWLDAVISLAESMEDRRGKDD